MFCQIKVFRSLGLTARVTACAGLALLLLTACSSQREISERVQLILNTDGLEPTTTFELRFDDLMVAADKVGQRPANSPLVITPPIAGSFVWLSQRSGLFTPSEPTELGQTYRFSMRADLRRDKPPRLRRTFRTPPLLIDNASAREMVSSNAPSEPVIQLHCDAEIRAAEGKSFFDFRNAGGARIPAEVRQATGHDYFDDRFYRRAETSALTWKQQFFQAAQNPAGHPSRRGQVEESSSAPIPNRLVVTPAQPLPVGKRWRLVVAKELPSPETTSRMVKDYEVVIGDVTPFAVANAVAENRPYDAKRISLNFSKEISSAIDTNNWAEWISIHPRPAHLSAYVEGHGLCFYGDFLLDTQYEVQVRAGFPAEEAFRLGQETKRVLQFSPLPPRLYFPAFTTSQLEGGTREFYLLALNVPQVRVRAKQLDRYNVIHALRGYSSYYKRRFDEDDYLEPYRELDFNVVPGRTIFDEVIVSSSEGNRARLWRARKKLSQRGLAGETPALLTSGRTDEARKVSLNWDEILEPGRPGAVFLAAEQPASEGRARAKLGTQALVQLTDLGMMWKHSRATGEMMVYIFSHATGKPVPDATVHLMSDDNESLAQAKTDAQGLAQLAIDPLGQKPIRATKSGRLREGRSAPQVHWLLAEAGDDLHAVPLENAGMSLYGFNIPVDWWSEEAENHKALLFSDRSVYRPGETLHFKSIVRNWHDSQLEIPAVNKASFTCFDAKGQKFFETNVILTPMGSWSESVPLPQGALGQYRAELKIDGQEHSHWFQVQEFQPNPFEISLPTKSTYAAGEKIQVPVAASYYMGKNLSRAKVRWSVEASDSGFAPAGFDDFVFGTAVSQSELGRNASSFALQGEGMLSNKTAFVIAPEITFNPTAPQPRSANLFVEITDLNQQTVSRRANFTSFSSDFYLGIKHFKDVMREGERLPIELIAVCADGAPGRAGDAPPSHLCTIPLQAHLIFQHIEWRTIRVQGAGRTRSYRTEAVLTNIFEQDVSTCAVRWAGDKWEIEPATAPSTVLVPPEAGLYLVEVRVKDAAGRDVVTAVTLNVSGKDQLAWNYRNEAQLDLVPDQKSYLAGETATVLVKAPFSGTALVTVEREKVQRSFVTELTGNAPTIRVPLESNDAPNVFVSVLLVRGTKESPKRAKSPEYRLGYCQINLANPATKLDLAITSDAADYRPGQIVHLVTEVRDFTGRPVPEVEVTLYVVDEGILSLTGSPNPDPYNYFYQTRPLSVRSSLSLPNLLPEDPEELGFQNKGYLVGGGGRSERLRKNFLPCAFWNATLQAGTNGQVQASFIAPDSLTRYRVVAIAHSAQNQFGSSQASFQVNKPLMLEPALPRFANVTDHILARAVIHNQTDQSGVVEVALQLDERAKHDSFGSSALCRTLTVPARSSAPIEFPLEMTSAGAAQWIWKARFTEPLADTFPPSDTRQAPRMPFTDSVQSTLSVGHITPLLREIYLSRTETSETNLLASANPQLLEGKGTLTVSVSNTRLSALGEAVSQLLHYPYGCVEQTSSSLLPWLVLRDFVGVIPQVKRAPAEMDAAIQEGIRRLLSMQTQSGGLSYWPGGTEPMLWGSAYGGMVLAMASRHGLAIPQANLDQLLTYLSAQLRQTSNRQNGSQLSDSCLALYTLALAAAASRPITSCCLPDGSCCHPKAAQCSR